MWETEVWRQTMADFKAEVYMFFMDVYFCWNILDFRGRKSAHCPVRISVLNFYFGVNGVWIAVFFGNAEIA